MKLSLVIVHYQSFRDLDRCLTAIQNYAPASSYEIIVVDNHSAEPEQEREFLKKWEHKIHYLPAPENLGFGKGNNFGAKHASGEYLFIMNPDVEVMQGAFDEAVRYLDVHKEVGVLGGKLFYLNGTIQDSYRRFPTLLDQCIKRLDFLRRRKILRKRVSQYLMWNKDPNVTEPVDWVIGGFLCVRRKAFNEVGGFDGRYFLFMEDVDLCRQMWEHGWQVIYHAGVRAMHRAERLSSGGMSALFRKKTTRIHVKSALQYFWKYRGQSHPRMRR